jgi:hypothetical protein
MRAFCWLRGTCVIRGQYTYNFQKQPAASYNIHVFNLPLYPQAIEIGDGWSRRFYLCIPGAKQQLQDMMYRSTWGKGLHTTCAIGYQRLVTGLAASFFRPHFLVGRIDETYRTALAAAEGFFLPVVKFPHGAATIVQHGSYTLLDVRVKTGGTGIMDGKVC